MAASVKSMRTIIQDQSKSIIAQYCFTFDMVAVQVQKEAAITQYCLHDCRQTLSRLRFNFYHWVFAIHMPTIISILYSINRSSLALFETLPNSYDKIFIQPNSRTHTHSCNPLSPQTLLSFLHSIALYYQESPFNPCTKFYWNKSKLLFARLFDKIFNSKLHFAAFKLILDLDPYPFFPWSSLASIGIRVEFADLASV